MKTISFQDLIEKEKEQRRIFILDTAEKLFFARGFSGVPMEDIAREVGVNKATLYLYFENKDSLFHAIVLRNVRTLNRMYEDCLLRNISGNEKVQAICQIFFDFAKDNPEYFRLVCITGPMLQRDTDNPVAQVVQEIQDRQLILIQKAVVEGIEDGSIRKDVHPLETAIFINLTTTAGVCLNTSWRKMLQGEGIGYDQFITRYQIFIRRALEKTLNIKEDSSEATTA